MTIRLTDAIILEPTTKRRRLFDKVCRDFHADILPSGTITFRLKVWSAARGVQETITLGKYNPECFTIEHARIAAWKLKGQGGDIVAKARDTEAAIVRQGVTFNKVADEYIAYYSTPIKKHGAMLPRLESWKNAVVCLRPAREAFGNRSISEVAARDIAKLLRSIVDRGKLGMARKVRATLYAVFKFAGEPDREYVTGNPCSNLAKMDPHEAKDRFLTSAEIRTFWHGLDDPNVPCSRRIALAWKLILATALRPTEVLTATVSSIGKFTPEERGDGLPAYAVSRYVIKKRQPIVQPLNSLALEIIAELTALGTPNGKLFPSITVNSLGRALRGVGAIKRGGWQRGSRQGVYDWLGLKPFTSHDLRRTATTHLGLAGVSLVNLAQILDHKKRTGEGVSASTLVYARGEINERRATLDTLDGILRGIIGKPPSVVKLRVA
jgi:Site-specific recombinase XerD